MTISLHSCLDAGAPTLPNASSQRLIENLKPIQSDVSQVAY